MDKLYGKPLACAMVKAIPAISRAAKFCFDPNEFGARHALKPNILWL
jgi:hypothetical protein